MIILLDGYSRPKYTTRVWCIFEVYTATMCNIHIDVALPEASKIQFFQRLRQGDFAEIADSLQTIDVEKAEASVQADADAIRQKIESTTGFTAVNETVIGALSRWLSASFKNCLVEDTISKVGRVIFTLITSNDTNAFELKHWIQATRQHPALVEFLELDNTYPDVAFCSMQKDTSPE